MLPEFSFRKPIDLALGFGGELFVVEHGDSWGGNRDGRILKIEYERGNRALETRLSIDHSVGRQPLAVQLDPGLSADPDGDEPLRFEWSVDGQPLVSATSQVTQVFTTPGEHRITVRVFDPSNASSSASTVVKVGNAEPVVQFIRPASGSIVDPETTIAYELSVVDH